MGVEDMATDNRRRRQGAPPPPPKAPTTDRGTYTVSEAARRLGIGTTTLYDLIHRGEPPVPVMKVGRQFRFSRAAVESFLLGEHTAS
jgi:excisionase family DNA binding protein